MLSKFQFLGISMKPILVSTVGSTTNISQESLSLWNSTAGFRNPTSNPTRPSNFRSFQNRTEKQGFMISGLTNMTSLWYVTQSDILGCVKKPPPGKWGLWPMKMGVKNQSPSHAGQWYFMWALNPENYVWSQWELGILISRWKTQFPICSVKERSAWLELGTGWVSNSIFTSQIPSGNLT